MKRSALGFNFTGRGSGVPPSKATGIRRVRVGSRTGAGGAGGDSELRSESQSCRCGPAAAAAQALVRLGVSGGARAAQLEGSGRDCARSWFRVAAAAGATGTVASAPDSEPAVPAAHSVAGWQLQAHWHPTGSAAPGPPGPSARGTPRLAGPRLTGNLKASCQRALTGTGRPGGPRRVRWHMAAWGCGTIPRAASLAGCAPKPGSSSCLRQCHGGSACGLCKRPGVTVPSNGEYLVGDSGWEFPQVGYGHWQVGG